jgi:SAM-dependent methyltransferase
MCFMMSLLLDQNLMHVRRATIRRWRLRLRDLGPATWKDRLAVWRERAVGLDFTQPVRTEAIGLDPARSEHYSPSGNRHLRRVLSRLDIRACHRMLDIGCGKGSAMRLMLTYPFAAVDGVELSDDLAEVARRNFTQLGEPGNRWKVFVADASEFQALDEYSHFYFYNPFPCEVMREVMVNLHASLDRRPREVSIVYYNAVCAAEITRGGRFRVTSETADSEGNRILVFSH